MERQQLVIEALAHKEQTGKTWNQVARKFKFTSGDNLYQAAHRMKKKQAKLGNGHSKEQVGQAVADAVNLITESHNPSPGYLVIPVNEIPCHLLAPLRSLVSALRTHA
jgi:hypothetical protein